MILDCVLTPIGDTGKGFCAECDPKKRRRIPLEAHRNCQAKMRNRTPETIQQIVETLCGPCDERNEDDGCNAIPCRNRRTGYDLLCVIENPRDSCPRGKW